jgi:hypothetical protein
MIINYKKNHDGTKVIIMKFKAKNNAKKIYTVTTNEFLSIATCDCEKYKRTLACYHINKTKSILENAFNIAQEIQDNLD